MTSRIAFLALVLSVATPAQAEPVIYTGLSDWADVVQAVNEANAAGSGTVGFKARTEIAVEGPLPAITGILTFEGNGATLVPAEVSDEPMVQVEEKARVEIRDLFITGFMRNYPGEDAERHGLIDNQGQAVLDRVTLANNPHCEDCRREFSLIVNRNFMLINNVTVFGNKTKSRAVLENYGDLRITHSTFSDNGAFSYYCSLGPCFLVGRGSSLFTAQGSSTSVGNTVLHDDSSMGHLPSNCLLQGEIVDLGGNVFTDPFCDSIVEVKSRNSTKLGSFGYHGGLVPTLGLEPGSAAIDTGVDENCSATDARFANRPASGSLMRDRKCDAGAFEYGGGFGNSNLAASGMNGLWFSRHADGHYVHVMRVSPDRVHITWTAFDQSANQMWIYAVADSTGNKSLAATAYINLDGQLIPGSAPSGSHVEEWGEMELELENCMKGTFRYRADDPEIGSGEFQLDRLAFVEGSGCTD
jgi:hypothetical protein